MSVEQGSKRQCPLALAVSTHTFAIIFQSHADLVSQDQCFIPDSHS